MNIGKQIGVYKLVNDIKVVKLVKCKQYNVIEEYYNAFADVTIPKGATVVVQSINSSNHPNDDLRSDKIKIDNIEKKSFMDKCFNLYYEKYSAIKNEEYEIGKEYLTKVDKNFDGDRWNYYEDVVYSPCKPGFHFMLDRNKLINAGYKTTQP